VGSMFSMKCQ